MTSIVQMYEAAKLLAKEEDYASSKKILIHLWKNETDFRYFAALCELLAIESPLDCQKFLEEVLSDGSAWSRNRSLLEQATIYEWAGELALHQNDDQSAFEHFSRSASLGRDTQNLWFHLAKLYLDSEDMELAVRYLQRSLALFRQPGLNIISSNEFCMGSFIGNHPLKMTYEAREYYAFLLHVVKKADGRKFWRLVRDLVKEMEHQFPDHQPLKDVLEIIEKKLLAWTLKQGSLIDDLRTVEESP